MHISVVLSMLQFFTDFVHSHRDHDDRVMFSPSHCHSSNDKDDYLRYDNYGDDKKNLCT